jgi:threonine/homoserine/homoserine lactone efflux protein
MPSASSLLAFALASAVLVAVPGPSVLFIVGRAISAGRRDALLTVAGNTLGVYTQMVLVALGLGPVVAASATAYTVLKVAGSAYLMWLGVQAIRHRRRVAEALTAGLTSTVPTLHAVRSGYVVGVTNPKAVVFFAALLPQFVDPAAGSVALQMLALGVVFAAIALASDGTMALLAGRAREWVARSPRRMERVGGAGGLMMIGLGTGLLLTGRPEPR